MTGSYPWKTTKDYTTIIYITNISDREAEFVAQINDGAERFVIDPRKLKPGETAVFDLAKIRNEQMQDNVGRRLPKEASLGQFKWAVRGLTDGKLLLIGRAEMVSLSEHVTTSYSCNDPCPPYYVMYIDGFPNLANVSQTTPDFTAWETAQYGNGYLMGPYTGYVSCSVDYPIATFDSGDSGHSTCITGTAPGEAYVHAFSRMEESYGYDGRDCYDNYNQYEVGSIEPLEVSPTITSLNPSRGPIGTTVPVSILGSGFTSSSTVAITGNGVTASSVNFSGSTLLTANFQIATDAIEGNHAVTVTTNNVTSNSVNFFVQIPARLARFNFSGAPNGYGPLTLTSSTNNEVRNVQGAPLATNQCGVYRNLVYELKDQQGQALPIPFDFTETFSNYSGVASLPGDLSGHSSSGLVQDTMYFGKTLPACPASNDNESFDQMFIVSIGNRQFLLSTVVHISRGRFSGDWKVDVTTTTP
jgi:hypothetical protein